MHNSQKKVKDLKGTLRQLMNYLKPYRLQLIFIIVLAAISTSSIIVGPKLLGQATNYIVSNLHQPQFDFKPLIHILLILIAIYIISAIFSYIFNWILTNITQKISYHLRQQISEKINHLPLSYFDKTTHGEVLSRLTNDVDVVSQTLNQSLSQIVTALITLIGITIMMLSISWQLTLVSLLVLPLSVWGVVFVASRSQKQFLIQQKELGHLNGHIEEMYSGHEVMQAFNGQKKSITKFSHINEQLYHSAWKAQFLSGLMWPIMHFISNLGYVVVATYGGFLAVNGRLMIGDIQAFIQYVHQFHQPIMQVAQITNILQSTLASAERVFEFLNEPEMSPDLKTPKNQSTSSSHITFDNVSFGYDPKNPVIKNLNLDIKPGQRIAIVGPTGAGKTTLVNLLMRFYDVDKGSIKIDGTDITTMKRSDVRKLFGMVLQDTWLFNGTIAENILYGNEKASDSEMRQAAKDAHADHFIQSLPEGYNMQIDEEATNISQGEKQLLTIARALLADTPIVILDEATSSVDTRTELLIQEAMNNLLKDKTSFIIAHRLSTIRQADLILVMNNGQIVEQGTHHELLDKNGFYAELYNSQFTENED